MLHLNKELISESRTHRVARLSRVIDLEPLEIRKVLVGGVSRYDLIEHHVHRHNDFSSEDTKTKCPVLCVAYLTSKSFANPP